MAYSEKVIDHYENPRNVGKMDIDDTVGTGMVGAPACGDVMKLQIKVEDGIVTKVGPTNRINKSYVIEKDKKIEIYLENDKEDLRPYYLALSKEGRMLLDYIMLYCLRENKLYCYIDTKEFMEKYNLSSRTTVWNCKKNLIDNTFIASTSCQGWFWINPKFIFKGYRSKLDDLKNNLKFKNDE
jgi:hypothetical protein